MNILERAYTETDWITLALVLSLLGMAILKAVFSEHFTLFSSLLTSNKYIVSYGKEINKKTRQFSLLGWFLRQLVLSFLIFYFLKICISETIDLIAFVRVLTMLATLFGIKYFFEKLLVSILSLDRISESYLFQKNTYLNYFSLFLIPFIAFITYAPFGEMVAFYAMISIFILLNFIGLYNVFKNHQNIFLPNLFYFILYLCALEIAPFVILYKVLVSDNKLI